MTTTTNPLQITIGGDLCVNRIGYGAMKLTGDQVWDRIRITTTRSGCYAGWSTPAST